MTSQISNYYYYLKESNVEMEPTVRESFFKLNYIKESLKKRDIGPALEWAKENRARLENHVSIL